jgi:hypothetical protein
MINKIKNLTETFQELKSVLRIKSSTFFWAMYIFILTYMLLHTAWFFTNAQSKEFEFLGYALAIAIEFCLIGFTHNFVNGITSKTTWSFTFIASTFGLIMSCLVSGLANFSYSFQFKKDILVLSEFPWMRDWYVFEFSTGGLLPLLALIFSFVLAQASIDEQKGEWELKYIELENKFKKMSNVSKNQGQALELNADSIAKKDARIKKLESELVKYQPLAKLSKKPAFSSIVDFFEAETKTDKVNAIKQAFPELSPKGIMELTGASPSLISNLNGKN